MEKTQYTAAPPDTDKALYWYSILVKCARLLDLPDDEPIPSGVLRKVEELAALAAAPAQAVTHPKGNPDCRFCLGSGGVPLAGGRIAPCTCTAHAAPAQAEPIAYVRQSDLDKLADNRVAGVGMMLHKTQRDGMVPVYVTPKR